MELQILKIEKDKINFLEEVRKIIEANPYNDIKGIYLDYIMDDKIKLSIEYEDRNDVILLFKVKNNEIENIQVYNHIGHEIVPTSVLLDDIKNIGNLIENYKDEIESKYKAKLIEVRDGFYLRSRNIFIYKINEISYIYNDDVYTIIMNRDNIVETKTLDKSVRDDSLLSNGGKDFVEKIKSLNKIQIRKALGYSTFMDRNTEYINKKHLYNQLERFKESKEKKAFFSLQVLNSFMVFTWLFVLFFGPVSTFALALILIFDALILFSVEKKIASIRSCAHNLEEFMSENHFEDSYVRWGDIEYKLHEFYLAKHIDEIYRYIHGPIKVLLSSGSNFKETKEEPIVEDNDNILYIENKYNIEELDETNALIKEIKDKGLNIENKTLLEYQIPTLKKHLDNFNIMNDSNKKLLIDSITLLNERLKEILDDYRDEEDMELSAELQALYNSLL